VSYALLETDVGCNMYIYINKTKLIGSVIKFLVSRQKNPESREFMFLQEARETFKVCLVSNKIVRSTVHLNCPSVYPSVLVQ
jgi:hypothetical protein